ncbi:beta-hydroxyacyl-ACP dehydratase [Paenibacillus athensensis]|uniref:3-hydroxyacyl-ACP dehydratase n=1 Tax=Paenibacillus athensensis TaxID=1967502 RepID=A0A4Y8Q1S2_9BACL|nr:AfsA-related hotdog domain-containing protein [Paenibacillus athensensis]MCD1258327.1 beta-hydroxyacyl-ACP dehydratase [Paenibacillus athensensis]
MNPMLNEQAPFDLRLDRERIRQMLPRPYPFIFIDAVQELLPWEKIVCVKNIGSEEWALPGEEQKQALFPGMLLIEAMTQACTLLFKAGPSEHVLSGAMLLPTHVNSEFMQPVTPGEQVVFTCEVVRMFSRAAMVAATAEVDGQLAARAELSFAVV